MNRKSSLPLLLVVLVAAAVFIWLSDASLPPVVASHFVSGGRANGFMPRGAYLGLMLATAVGMPLILSLVTGGITRLLPDRFINLPNRDYWLAPERRQQTFDYLADQGYRFAILLCAFFCFMHWLVIRANEQQPPRLPESMLFTALAVFLVALVIWLGAFFIRFRRRPST
jgi:hypothetical protein